MENNSSGLMIGFAMTGSFCTFGRVIPQAQNLIREGYGILPIMSETSYSTDTRFGAAREFADRLERITGRPVIHSIREAEPIGPQKLLNALVIAPCTGNTLAKLANGIADTTVTLAAKSHLRNGRPILIAVSSNDALGANARSLGTLLARKNFYFVPFGQDDSAEKENSLVAKMELISPALRAALEHRQLQPILQ